MSHAELAAFFHEQQPRRRIPKSERKRLRQPRTDGYTLVPMFRTKDGLDVCLRLYGTMGPDVLVFSDGERILDTDIGNINCPPVEDSGHIRTAIDLLTSFLEDNHLPRRVKEDQLDELRRALERAGLGME